MTFGERLKELRNAKGLTQAELAKIAWLSRDGIAKLENGTSQPSWDTVRALARALGVTLDEFDKEEE